MNTMILVGCPRCWMTWGTSPSRRWPCPCGEPALVHLGTWEPLPRNHLFIDQLWDRNRLDWDHPSFGSMLRANAGPCHPSKAQETDMNASLYAAARAGCTTPRSGPSGQDR